MEYTIIRGRTSVRSTAAGRGPFLVFVKEGAGEVRMRNRSEAYM